MITWLYVKDYFYFVYIGAKYGTGSIQDCLIRHILEDLLRNIDEIELLRENQGTRYEWWKKFDQELTSGGSAP